MTKTTITITEMQGLLEADLLTSDKLQCREIGMASGSDLMSDVLAFGKADSLLLTGLVMKATSLKFQYRLTISLPIYHSTLY